MLGKIYELSCDGNDCGNAYQPDFDELHSAVSIRAGAKRAGWTYRKGVDLCETCTHIPIAYPNS